MNEETLLRSLLDARHLLSAALWPLLRNHHAIEDVVQNTLIKALRAREDFQDAAHAIAWARVTSRNDALNHLLRHASRMAPLDEDVLHLLQADWRPDDTERVRCRVEAVKLCVEKLPERARALIEMRYHEGGDGRAMARRFHMSADAIYKALQRAHDALRTCVQAELHAKA
jgi:RNA polymerase sigma-70 factor (ECF subfamily)